MTVAAGQGRGGQAPAANTAPPAVQSLHVQGNVWMLVGPVVNAAVQIGDDGVLVVDTMTEGLADPLVAEVKRIAGDKPIRWIINTHVHADHTGGNAKVGGGRELDHRRELRGPGRPGRGQLRADHRAREHRQPSGRAEARAAGGGHAGRDVLR
jgi:glyoxylase-like metal-dependent hydrolase (beta-lactamase superfamily II)